MSAEEYRALTRRLKWTAADVARTCGVEQYRAESFEAGAYPIPERVAGVLRWFGAMKEQEELIAASGLPPCEQAAALESAEALLAHAKSCPTCQARSAYIAAHAPPLPELPLSAGMRAMGALTAAFRRLPPGIRPPEGAAGGGRMVGLFMASFLTLFVCGIVLLGAIAGLANGAGSAQLLGLGRLLAVMALGYFIGFWLAGAFYDLCRPIRRTLVGHAIVGALAAASIYGGVGVVMPLMDEKFALRDVPGFLAFVTPVGAIVGVGFWVKGWWAARGKRASVQRS